MYNKKLANYYDTLFKEKNYKQECELIKKYSEGTEKLLDIGCGTLNHSMILSDTFENILGIDDSEEMLNVAQKKLSGKKIQLKKTSLENLNLIDEYDTVISMFNVVNHIESLNELIRFFNQISISLKKNGVFIFDCWNGVACTIEKPTRFSVKKVSEDFHTVISETTTTTDLFNSVSNMYTKVEIFDDMSKIDEFEYHLKQKLWTPDVLIQLIRNSGMILHKIIPYFDDTTQAKDTDYRLTFICKKL